MDSVIGLNEPGQYPGKFKGDGLNIKNNNMNVNIQSAHAFSENEEDPVFGENMQLLINHVGYERFGTKTAFALSEKNINTSVAEIIDFTSGLFVMQLPIVSCDTVDQWKMKDLYQIDFTVFERCGTFAIKIGETLSPPFSIAEGILFDKTFSDVLHYFKSQRCSGIYNKQDMKAPLLGTQRTVDVRGGWYDASGDVSKYLSHLSASNYLSPQQIPMIVWNMLHALETLSPELDSFSRTRLQDEALFGADFLVRMQDISGFFYMTVFDKWSKDPEQREICAYYSQEGHKTEQYQAGFRQGAGMAIAALALAARLGEKGRFNTKTYKNAAETGYWHLKQQNIHYLDDRCENILDFYCALMAATELYQLTHNSTYLDEARIWALRLERQQQSDPQMTHFWAANADGSRPYFHAAEAGLPSIALMQYLKIEKDPIQKETFEKVLLNALRFELNITNEVHNPFGYPRQYIKNIDGAKRSSFFMAQKNETGYWWQGENARLGSLASMAFMGASYFSHDEILKTRLLQYGQNALNWILGLNPFDICMLDGHGRNNPDYLPELGFFNAKGGICNGITAGFENEHDIAFKPLAQKEDMLQNWRWGEQWIPHAGWYLLAVAMQKEATKIKKEAP